MSIEVGKQINLQNPPISTSSCAAGAASAMEVGVVAPATTLLSSRKPSLEPNTEAIKRRLLRKGVFPTPKILRVLKKKETLKLIRKSKRLVGPSSEPQKRDVGDEEVEEALFRTAKREYRTLTRAVKGLPWEGASASRLKELAETAFGCEFGGEEIRREGLADLREMLAQRLLEDDLEGEFVAEEEKVSSPPARWIGDADRIRVFVDRLSSGNLHMSDWKFSRLMDQSGIQFTERHLLRIIDGLGSRGHWRHALSVVEWVYRRREYKYYRSRFVYTKILAILGRARRPSEALYIFNMMLEDCHIYPDMPAYHSIAVVLGQAGFVKELLNIIECMGRKPSKRIKNMRRKNWDRCLEPDVVIFNAILNACVSSRQWKGVAWVLGQMRQRGLKPNCATYGLAMEVMLKSGKYDLVYKFFEKMKRSGLSPKALTYKVLVRAFWEEGKVNKAVEAVKDMEQTGVVGTAAVYYELACCLCCNGRWQEAMEHIEKMKTLPLNRPLEVSFTGMIRSCLDGGHVYDCISIFESMNCHCTPNIGTINAMLEVYGRNDMFSRAKALFEETKNDSASSTSLTTDIYTYTIMLEASASSHQWEYFEHVYKEMILHGFRLDHNKHAWVLTEASQAGKWHLLEHAFDAILEAGEIPHLSLFTEMICQSIARQDYERAVSLANSIGHTSLQFSERQWTNLFVKNQDRVIMDKLTAMLDALNSCNITTGTVVSNLLKSLQLLCSSSACKESSKMGVLGNGRAKTSSSCESDMDMRSTTTESVHHSLTKNASENLNFDKYLFDEDKEDGDDDGDAISNTLLCYHTDNSDNENSDRDIFQSRVMATERTSTPSDVNVCGNFKLPTATEILKQWQKSQMDEGIFPFLL